MSAAAAEKRRWTVEEYLEMEGGSAEKHEFYDGEVFAMAGASYEHDQIVARLIFSLMATMRGRCEVFTSDLRLYAPAQGKNHFTYSDGGVICQAPVFTEHLIPPQALTNPELIVEVLSPSTEAYDRGKKFESYQSIPALQHYILVAQDRVRVEHFTRQPDGGWLVHGYGRGQKVPLPCEGTLAVDDLYFGLKL